MCHFYDALRSAEVTRSAVGWDIASRSPVDTDCRFRQVYGLHHQGEPRANETTNKLSKGGPMHSQTVPPYKRIADGNGFLS
jgi:hypothetical protein